MTDTVNVMRDAVLSAIKEADRQFDHKLSDYRYRTLADAALAAAPKAEPVSDPASDELLEALAPFAKAAKIRLCGEWRDDERFWNTDAASHLTFGDLRRAERLYDKHKEPQS